MPEYKKQEKRGARVPAAKPIQLDDRTASRVRRGFGIDPSQLQLSESDEVRAMGARAVAKGNVIRFAPGEFSPGAPGGMEVLGHELAHVRSQAKGETPMTGGALEHPGLEAAADRAGEAFASGSLSAPGPVDAGALAGRGAPAQHKKKKKRRPGSMSSSIKALREADIHKRMADFYKNQVSNVQYDESLPKEQADNLFMVRAGMRENHAVLKPYKDALVKMSSPMTKKRMKKFRSKQKKGLKSASKIHGSEMLYDRSNVGLRQSMYDTSIEAMMEALGDEGIQEHLRQGAKSYRSATAGREGKQDFFGDKDTLDQVMAGTLSLYGVMPAFTTALDPYKKDPTLFSALAKMTQGSIGMQNLFNVAVGNLGTGEFSDEDFQKEYDKFESNPVRKQSTDLFTKENFRKYQAVVRAVSGAIGDVQTLNTPGPQPTGPAPQPPQPTKMRPPKPTGPVPQPPQPKPKPVFEEPELEYREIPPMPTGPVPQPPKPTKTRPPMPTGPVPQPPQTTKMRPPMPTGPVPQPPQTEPKSSIEERGYLDDDDLLDMITEYYGEKTDGGKPQTEPSPDETDIDALLKELEEMFPDEEKGGKQTPDVLEMPKPPKLTGTVLNEPDLVPEPVGPQPAPKKKKKGNWLTRLFSQKK